MSDIMQQGEDRVDDVVRRVDVLEVTHQQMSTQVKEIHEALLGNFDKQGLVSRVRDIEKRCAGHKRRTPEWVEHAFKGAVAAALAWFGLGGAK